MPYPTIKESDTGRNQLIKALSHLLERAKQGDFHDFASDTVALPKQELAASLEALRKRTIDGDFDNIPND